MKIRLTSVFAGVFFGTVLTIALYALCAEVLVLTFALTGPALLDRGTIARTLSVLVVGIAFCLFLARAVREEGPDEIGAGILGTLAVAMMIYLFYA